MKKTIITISREFGSGGRTIGHQVAERLGYPYYDKELIKTVAEKTGFDPNMWRSTANILRGKACCLCYPPIPAPTAPWAA